jgi:hypothetical protein
VALGAAEHDRALDRRYDQRRESLRPRLGMTALRHRFRSARARRPILLRDERSRGSLSSLTAPTLVIHGTANPMFLVEHGGRPPKKIGGATFLPVARAGRVVQRADWKTIIGVEQRDQRLDMRHLDATCAVLPRVAGRSARRDRLTGRVSCCAPALMRRGLLWGCVAACGSWIGGCSLVEGCDTEDCSPGVFLDGPGITVDPDELLTIRACVEGTCGVRRSNFAGGQVEVRVPDNTDEVSVTVTIGDHTGRVVARGQGTARVELLWPNGDDCPPECRVVRVRLEAGRLLPATA